MNMFVVCKSKTSKMIFLSKKKNKHNTSTYKTAIDFFIDFVMNNLTENQQIPLSIPAVYLRVLPSIWCGCYVGVYVVSLQTIAIVSHCQRFVNKV